MTMYSMLSDVAFDFLWLKTKNDATESNGDEDSSDDSMDSDNSDIK